VTLDEIEAEVESILVDLPSETVALIPTFVRRAQKKIEDAHGFIVMESNKLFTTTTGQRYLGGLPTNWARAMDDPAWIDGYGKDTPIEWIQREREITELYDEADPLDKGAPKHLLLTDTAILVYPYPDALNPVGTLYNDGLYRIRVPYWKRESTLSGEIEQNWWTNNAEMFLIYYAAADGFLMNRDYAEQARWEIKWRDELRRLTNLDKRQRLGRHAGIRPRAFLTGARRESGWRL
jgi:hypothetical protein